MAHRKGAYHHHEEREKKSSQSLGSTLILKKMLGLEQNEKEGRNTYNRFYNTNEDEGTKGSGQKAYEDKRNNQKFESKYVLHQNQVKLVENDQQHSRPHLPKNANITGNLLHIENKEPYVFPPDFHKKIKLTQDQIRAPIFYSSIEESPASQKNHQEAANESEECGQRITSYSLNTSQNLKGKMFYQTQILNGKKVQDNHYQDNRIYEKKPLVRPKKISSSHRHPDNNIYGNRFDHLNQSQDIEQTMNILSGGATLQNQKTLSKSNMSNYGQQRTSANGGSSGNPSLGRANQGKQFFIGLQKRQQPNLNQQNQQQNQIVLRMQAQSQMSSYNLGKQKSAGAQNHYQNKGSMQKKQAVHKETELMNASAPLNMQNIKQGVSFDGHNQKVNTSQSIQDVKKIPNNTKVTNTMGTLNATDIYNINQNKVARSTQNQRFAMGRTDKNQIYLNMNKGNDEKQLYYNKKAQKIMPKNQRINRPQSSQQMNPANLNEVQLKQMKQLQQIQQMQLNNSQVQIGLKQSSLYANEADLETSFNNRPKSMMNNNKAQIVKKQVENLSKRERKISNSLENLRSQANNEYLMRQQLCTIKPQMIIKKPAQMVTIIENELAQPLTNLNLGSFEPSDNDTGPKIKKNVKLNPVQKKPVDKSSRKRKIIPASDKERIDTLQSTQLIRKMEKVKIHHENEEIKVMNDEDQHYSYLDDNIRLSNQHAVGKNRKFFQRQTGLIDKVSAELQQEMRQLITEGQQEPHTGQIRSKSSMSDFREKKVLNMTQPAGLNPNAELEEQYLLFQQGTMPHEEYQDFTDQHLDESEGYFKVTNTYVISPLNEKEEIKKNGSKKHNTGGSFVNETFGQKRGGTDASNDANKRPQSISYQNQSNMFQGDQNLEANQRYQEKPPQSQKSGGSQAHSQGKKKRSSSRGGGFMLPTSNINTQKKTKIVPQQVGQMTSTNKAQVQFQNKKKIVTQEPKKKPSGDVKLNLKQIHGSINNSSTVTNRANLITNPHSNTQTLTQTQKKFKLSNTQKTQQMVINKKKEQKQMISTLLNFYASKQKEQLPLPQKKQMMTQKINIKEMFAKQPMNSHVVNDAYLKGARNSSLNAKNSLNATQKSNKIHKVNNRVTSSLINQKPRTNDARANSENKHQKANQIKFLQQTQTNISGGLQSSMLAIDEDKNNTIKQPLSLQYTNMNLTQNLRNVHAQYKNCSGKINLLSTLKGGIGIMNNLSNGQQDSQIEGDGKQILQIDSVLNQINQNHQEGDEMIFVEQMNYSQNPIYTEEENHEEEDEYEEQMKNFDEEDEEEDQTKSDVYGINQKGIQLELKHGDGAGSMIPGLQEIENNSAIEKEKKKQNYIAQLQEDLEEKLKERYAYANQQMHNQSNNQILMGTDPSVHDNSSNGGKSSQGDNSNNRVHNYIFGKQIGEGAYAVVRIATSREDNQKYAIKIYDKTKLNDINRQRSVRREVVLLQKMNHEHIVKLIEAFETDSHVYLVMENVSGGSLHSYLKEVINKQLDEEEARRIFQQILVALQYCHGKCIAHRDIKLENILLDENKNVKLIDFGFSTCIPNHKKIRMFCGTPSYMAPQIVSKVEYSGPPADIWASGVLLYALLNGCFPFRGQTDDDLYRRIKRGTYQIHNQKVSREYLDILQRCLDINDDTRATAADLIDDQWFKIKDIRQRAYDEEKRAFKARILAKVPIIKKTNHTICILAGQPNQIQPKDSNADLNAKQGVAHDSNNGGNSIPGSVGSNSASNTAKQTPEQKQGKLKKANGLQGLTIINQNEKHILQVNHNNIGNFPYTNNQNANKCELIISDYGLHSGVANNEKQANENASGGAILLSYGAAVAPQIQINNINNLNLISQNMKKKLNHEAYQAYYNTSSANTANCGINIQSSPIAQVSGGQNNTNLAQATQQAQNPPSSSGVYGQPESNFVAPQAVAPQTTNVQQEPPSIVDSGRNSIPSNSQTGEQQPKLRQIRSSGQSSDNNIASDQSSPYGSAYHHNLVNNQMAQLQQLQQEVIQEQQRQRQNI